MFDKFFRRKEEAVVVADIGSGSAAVGVAIIAKDRMLITHAERSALPFEERTEAQTIAGIGQKLNEVGSKVIAAYAASDTGRHHGAPTRALAVIRAPWARSATEHKEISLPHEISITQKMVEDVARTAMDEERELERANIFEAGVVRVELNGYPTSKPKGLMAHTIGTTVLESDCNPAVRSLVTESFGSFLPGRNVVLRSNLRALVSAAGNRLKTKRSYLLVDMGSAATSFAAINHDAIEQHTVIPVGVRTVLHKIAGPNGLPEETLGLLRMVGNEQCNDGACMTVATSLTAVEPELMKLFGEALSKLASVSRLPNLLVLAVHPDMAPWLSHFLSRLDFSQFTATMRPFSVELFTPEALSEKINFEPTATPDTGLAVAAALFNTSLK